MKARLTTISLTLPTGVFEIGDLVERGVDLPEALFDARIQAGAAVLVDQASEVTAATREALAQYRAAFASLRAALIVAVEAVELGGLADARAFVDELVDAAPSDFIAAVDSRFARILRQVQDADEAALQTLSPDVSPVSGGDEAGGPTAASDAGDDRGGPSPAEDTGGADQATASTDATQPEPGLDGDAGGAQTPPAEPASPEPSAPKQKSARKGGVRGG